jgi:hypothetical protein
MIGVDRRTSLGDLNSVDGTDLFISESEPSTSKGEEE